MEDVKNFFFSYYAPNNAILSVSGDVKPDEIFRMAEKWFAPIERRTIPPKSYSDEPPQTEARVLTVERDVPVESYHKVYHTSSRMSKDYYLVDMISDILSNGKSSRLYQKLVVEQQIFNEIDAYITGTFDNGLFVVTGKPADGIDLEFAEKAADAEIDKMKIECVSDYELQKVKNKLEANMLFSEIKNINKAINLGYFELLGDAGLINSEIENYSKVTAEDLREAANRIIQPSNCSTMYYRKKQS